MAFVLFTGLAGAAYGMSRLSLPPALRQNLTTTLTDANGQTIAQLSAGENRQPVTINQVPQVVVDAVVATEDRHFFQHHGVDPVGIVRAALSDLLGRGSLQGASTLTQQYVKTAYLGQQRTLSRKIKESVLALKIERQLTKRQILERYLNTIYFGRGAYGIEAASQVYFHKAVGDLTVPEAAFLAGAIRAPEYADPVTDPVTAKARRDRTLTDLVQMHKLTKAQADAYKNDPVEALPYTPKDQKIVIPSDASGAPGLEYFVSYVTQKLISSYQASVVYGGGLKVRTSLDLRMQQAAFNSVYNQVLVSKNGPAGALISLDNSGAIKAMVGGRNYAESKVNLAVGTEGGGAGRQAGSTMKGVLLAEVVREGYSVLSTFRAPAQITLRRANNGADWTVNNFGNEDFSGPDGTGTINLIDATKNSVNTVYAQAVVDVTPHNMANLAYTLGLGQLPAYASIVLGTRDESVMQMAGAYSVFADNGLYNQPHAILEVKDSNGNPKPLQLQAGRGTGLDKAMTDVITHCLRQVVLGGTGTAAGFRIPVAGKTGTTESNTDAWFVGYTPQPGLITAVWMGYPDKAAPMTDIYGVKGGITGGTLPADIFRRYMSQALVGAAAGNFDEPPGFPGKTLGQPVVAQFPTSTTTTSSTTPGESTTTTVPGQKLPSSTLPPAPSSTTTTPTTEVSTKGRSTTTVGK